MLNYVGQASFLLTSSDEHAFREAFFQSTPAPLLIPMIILATIATGASVGDIVSRR